MTRMDNATRQKKESFIWNKLAASYDSRVLKTYKDAYDLSIRNTCSILSPDHQVLEIGCGTGIISLGIAPFVERVVPTDISPKMISIAKGKAEVLGISNVDCRVCDGYSLPYESESFDVVLLFNTLHFVKEPATILREAHRLLKPSGYLVGATDCYAEPAPFSTRLRLRFQRLLNLLGIIPFVWCRTKKELHQLFEQSSFAVVETDVLHLIPANYYLLARKA